MKQERRAIYRVIPLSQDRLELILCSEAGNPVAQEIVDITIDGAGTRFPKDGAPSLAVGDQVKLCFTAPELPERVEVDATVAAHADAPDYQAYNFKFEDRQDLERELPEDFYRVFNRRGAYRAAAFDATPSVEVGMNARDTAPKKVSATGWLKNISATGLGALVDFDVASDFVGVDSVELTLQLPDSPRTLQMAAWVRNREPREDHVYYGFRFDANATEDYLGQEEEIVDFVLLRFQEKLAQAVH